MIPAVPGGVDVMPVGPASSTLSGVKMIPVNVSTGTQADMPGIHNRLEHFSNTVDSVTKAHDSVAGLAGAVGGAAAAIGGAAQAVRGAWQDMFPIPDVAYQPLATEDVWFDAMEGMEAEEIGLLALA